MFIPFINRFLQWFIVGLIVPILNLLMLSKGLNLQQLGLTTAIYSLIIVLLELPTGIFADTLGRKNIYILSLIVSFTGYFLLFVFAGFMIVTLGFALYGISRALSSGSIEAIYIDGYIVTRGKEKLHALMTAMNIGEAAGLAIGALVGGYIPILWEAYFKNANKYNGNLAFQMLFILVLLIFTIFSTKDKRTGAHNNIRMSDFVKESVSFVRANKIIKLLLVSVVFWGMTFSSIELYWQPHIKTILGSDQKTWIFGLLSSGYFMAAVVGSIVISFILSKYKKSYYSLLGVLRLIVAIFVIILSYQKSISAFAVIYLIMFMFNGMSSPPQSTVFNLEIPNDKRSSLLSLESLFMQLGGVIGAAVCGMIIMHTSIPVVWISAGLLYGISSILFFYISRKRNRAAESEQVSVLNHNRNR